MRNFIEKHHYYLKINTNLIPAKVVGGIQAFGSSSMYMFLSIHAKSLGLSASQIGFILAIMPVAIFFGPPIFCPLADKLQKHKFFLIIAMLLSAGFYATLTSVPEIPPLPNFNNTNLTSYVAPLFANESGSGDRNSSFDERNFQIVETFALYALIRLLAQISSGVAMAFMDAVNLDLL